jgi:hypothetical protein
MAERSVAWTVFVRSDTGVVGLNPTRGMDVYLCLFCLCCPVLTQRPCSGLIPRPRNPTDCVWLKNCKNRGQGPSRNVAPTDDDDDEVWNGTSHGLSSGLIEDFRQFNWKCKLVAQTCEGNGEMSGSLGAIHFLRKENFPPAKCVHSYAFQLNLVQKKVCSSIKGLGLIFADISVISLFSTTSPKRDMIEEIRHKRVLHYERLDAIFNPEFWNLSQKKKTKSWNAFTGLQMNTVWDDNSEALVFQNILQDEQFFFLYLCPKLLSIMSLRITGILEFFHRPVF